MVANPCVLFLLAVNFIVKGGTVLLSCLTLTTLLSIYTEALGRVVRDASATRMLKTLTYICSFICIFIFICNFFLKLCLRLQAILIIMEAAVLNERKETFWHSHCFRPILYACCKTVSESIHEGLYTKSSHR